MFVSSLVAKGTISLLYIYLVWYLLTNGGHCRLVWRRLQTPHLLLDHLLSLQDLFVVLEVIV